VSRLQVISLNLVYQNVETWSLNAFFLDGPLDRLERAGLDPSQPLPTPAGFYSEDLKILPGPLAPKIDNIAKIA
jgi:hypothetical protein